MASYSFPTKNDQINYTRSRINEIKGSTNLKKEYPEDYRYFMEILFQNHPNRDVKLEGVVNIIIRENPVFKSLEVCLLKNDNTIEDISRRKCITKPIQGEKLTRAMRTSIRPQIVDFKTFSINKCVLCDNTENLHVDHHEPQFMEIQNEFLTKHIASSLIPKNFKGDYGVVEFEECDKEFESRWKDYHMRVATLRILCQSCNLRRNKAKIHRALG